MDSVSAISTKKKRGRKVRAKVISSSIRKQLTTRTFKTSHDTIMHIETPDTDCDTDMPKLGCTVVPFNEDSNTEWNVSIPNEKLPDVDVPSTTLFTNGMYSLGEHGTHCWWCCSKPHSDIIGMPVSFCTKTRKFRTKGSFCSFNCIVAYAIDTKCYNLYAGYIKKLYSTLTGESILTKIEPAPNRFMLRMFGGPLTIEEFRYANVRGKVYKLVEYPMHVSRDFIREIDIQSFKTTNHESMKSSSASVPSAPRTTNLKTSIYEFLNKSCRP